MTTLSDTIVMAQIHCVFEACVVMWECFSQYKLRRKFCVKTRIFESLDLDSVEPVRTKFPDFLLKAICDLYSFLLDMKLTHLSVQTQISF